MLVTHYLLLIQSRIEDVSWYYFHILHIFGASMEILGRYSPQIRKGGRDFPRRGRAAALKPDAWRLRRIQMTGALLLVLPSTVNGMELGAQEWRYSICLNYTIEPPDLTSYFDWCGAAFKIYHFLDCKEGFTMLLLYLVIKYVRWYWG